MNCDGVVGLTGNDEALAECGMPLASREEEAMEDVSSEDEDFFVLLLSVCSSPLCWGDREGGVCAAVGGSEGDGNPTEEVSDEMPSWLLPW